METLSIDSISHNCWVPRVSAAVAQEEVAVAAEEEVSAAGEVEDSVTTKLYFGNLPYSVDSAQLAGIIQDYGSPELIEVFISFYFANFFTG